MGWFLLTIISILFATLASLLQKVLMKGKKSNPYVYATIFHLWLGVLNLLAALLVGSQFSFSQGQPVLLILSSLLWGANTIFMFKALQILEASQMSILSKLSVIVTIIASVVLLHENFDWPKVLGVGLILSSTLLVTKVKTGTGLNKGVVYTIAMAACSGLAIVVDSLNVRHYDPIAYNTFSNFLIGFMLLLFKPKLLKEWKNFINVDFLKIMIPLGILSTIQALANLYALSLGGHTAQIGTIRQASTLLSVTLAVLVLKERDNLLRKFLAVIIVVFGVLLLR